MPSWMIHLCIADKLPNKLKYITITELIMENITPDRGVPNEDLCEKSKILERD